MAKHRQQCAGRPVSRPDPWVQDEDCIGEEDDITKNIIPHGKAFRLDNPLSGEKDIRCYNIETMLELKKICTTII